MSLASYPKTFLTHHLPFRLSVHPTRLPLSTHTILPSCLYIPFLPPSQPMIILVHYTLLAFLPSYPIQTAIPTLPNSVIPTWAGTPFILNRRLPIHSTGLGAHKTALVMALCTLHRVTPKRRTSENTRPRCLTPATLRPHSLFMPALGPVASQTIQLTNIPSHSRIMRAHTPTSLLPSPHRLRYSPTTIVSLCHHTTSLRLTNGSVHTAVTSKDVAVWSISNATLLPITSRRTSLYGRVAGSQGSVRAGRAYLKI